MPKTVAVPEIERVQHEVLGSKPEIVDLEKQLKHARRLGIIIPGDREYGAAFKPLNPYTKVEGQYERAIKEVFLEMGLPASYHPLKFRIVNNDIYPPDFILSNREGSVTVGGRHVVVETHNGHASAYFNRMKKFRENYGDDFYLVLISSGKLFINTDMSRRVILHTEDEELRVDERWKMPQIKLDGDGAPDQMDHENWKEIVKLLLKDFLDGRTDAIPAPPLGQRDELAPIMRTA